ncbi:MAG: patatin family protein [Ancrocorticia sp.]|jgi:predicted patatin/cPLA2 family phospholipase|nr:patatin family protein [Ancrocorticia sp.]
MPSLESTALVFEGGGTRASSTAPLVVALIRAGIVFPHVSGISAGSSHLANYLSGDARRAKDSWVDFFTDPNVGGLSTFFHGQGYFNAHYIYEETAGPDQALPYDFEHFLHHPAGFRIGAYRVRDGQEVYWDRPSIKNLGDLLRKVRASSTMPGIMPQTEVDGEMYVDGALGPCGGIPLDAALADGYRNVVVVLTRPRSYVKTPPRHPTALRRYFRKYPMIAEGLIHRAANYNRTREQVFHMEQEGRAFVYAPEHTSVSNHEMAVAKLQASYDAGAAQVQRVFPELLRFLEL